MAELVDLKASIAARLPWALAVVGLATMVLLFLMTGSVVVAVKAVVMNVLSLGATFGVLVWVFQDGHLSGLLGFDAVGALDATMPLDRVPVRLRTVDGLRGVPARPDQGGVGRHR